MDILLTGWKRIADFIGVHPVTAKKYYYEYNMPVRRIPPNDPKGKPCGVPEEIRKWLQNDSIQEV